MTQRRLLLTLQPDILAICRLDPSSTITAAMLTGNFVAITKTNEELSIICSQDNIPQEVIYTKGWRSLHISEAFEPDATGVLAAVITPLAEAALSVFAVSTYFTAHILIKDKNLNQAIQILTQAGHTICSA
jgi:hypothetical protein